MIEWGRLITIANPKLVVVLKITKLFLKVTKMFSLFEKYGPRHDQIHHSFNRKKLTKFFFFDIFHLIGKRGKYSESLKYRSIVF